MAILVNTNDITSGEKKSIDLQPVVIANEHVAADTFAPSSEGYFDISVDPSNINVSYEYRISLEVLNKDMPDLMITQYSYIDGNGVEGEKTDIDSTSVVNGLIENAIVKQNLYDKEKPFEAFTIRIYFEWFEGDGEQQDDAADTLIGSNAAKVETLNNEEETETETTTETEVVEDEEVTQGKLKIKASISFKQLLKSEIETTEENESNEEV